MKPNSRSVLQNRDVLPKTKRSISALGRLLAACAARSRDGVSH